MKDQNNLITLRDFLPALEAMAETESDYCLVGGLAVGVWAETFLIPTDRTRFELPLQSKGIDIRATKSNAMMLLKNLKERGVKIGVVCKRTPKDPEKAFPVIAAPITLPTGITSTVEALSGMPTLDKTQPDGRIQTHGTALRFGNIQVMDPCSLMICKLAAIKGRPVGESDNDLKHATILSLVIPRFIQIALERHEKGEDPYQPRIDAQRLAGFLTKEPWKDLIPEHERTTILTACQMASGGDERADRKSGGKNKWSDPGMGMK